MLSATGGVGTALCPASFRLLPPIAVTSLWNAKSHSTSVSRYDSCYFFSRCILAILLVRKRKIVYALAPEARTETYVIFGETMFADFLTNYVQHLFPRRVPLTTFSAVGSPPVGVNPLIATRTMRNDINGLVVSISRLVLYCFVEDMNAVYLLASLAIPDAPTVAIIPEYIEMVAAILLVM